MVCFVDVKILRCWVEIYKEIGNIGALNWWLTTTDSRLTRVKMLGRERVNCRIVNVCRFFIFCVKLTLFLMRRSRSWGPLFFVY